LPNPQSSVPWPCFEALEEEELCSFSYLVSPLAKVTIKPFGEPLPWWHWPSVFFDHFTASQPYAWREKNIQMNTVIGAGKAIRLLIPVI